MTTIIPPIAILVAAGLTGGSNKHPEKKFLEALSCMQAWRTEHAGEPGNLPKGSYVLPFWGSILESPTTNPQGTTLEPLGRV